MDRFLKNNWVLRIIALVLSCIIWVTVSIQGNDTGTGVAATQRYPYSFPVHVLVDPNLVVTRIDSPTAVVEVQGSGLSVATLPAQMLGVAVQADARGLSPGTHQVRLIATGMPPVNYTIVPPTVTVVLDRKMTVSKDVKVNVQGQPANGYHTGAPITDVQTVGVTGVEADLDRVAYVQASVSIQAATQTVTKAVTLEPVDSQGNEVPGVDVNPVDVNVTIPVQSPQATASVVPEIIGKPATGFAISDVAVQPQSVQLQGTPSVTSNLLALNLPVNVNGFTSTHTLQVKVPQHAGISRVTPNTVSVTVKIEPAETKAFTGLPIAIHNLSGNTKVSISNPKSVDVTVSGPKSVVDRLQPSDVTVYIDGAHLNNSDTSAPLTVSIPNWVQVTDMSSHTAEITVSGANTNP